MKFIEHHKLKSLHKIEQNGIEAEAIVTKITSYYDRDMNHKTYITHVKFIGDDNNEHEGRLLNVSTLSLDLQNIKMKLRFVKNLTNK